jgi:ketosteroid isomerase-like protein
LIGAIIAKRKIRAAYDLINRRDLAAFLADWADNATFIFPGDVPSVSGKMEGKEAIEKWWQRFFEQFPKINFNLKNMCVENQFAFGGTNVLAAEWEVTLTNKQGQDFKNTGVTTVNLKGGRAILVRDYISDTDLLRKEFGV